MELSVTWSPGNLKGESQFLVARPNDVVDFEITASHVMEGEADAAQLALETKSWFGTWLPVKPSLPKPSRKDDTLTWRLRVRFDAAQRKDPVAAEEVSGRLLVSLARRPEVALRFRVHGAEDFAPARPEPLPPAPELNLVTSASEAATAAPEQAPGAETPAGTRLLPKNQQQANAGQQTVLVLHAGAVAVTRVFGFLVAAAWVIFTIWFLPVIESSAAFETLAKIGPLLLGAVGVNEALSRLNHYKLPFGGIAYRSRSLLVATVALPITAWVIGSNYVAVWNETDSPVLLKTPLSTTTLAPHTWTLARRDMFESGDGGAVIDSPKSCLEDPPGPAEKGRMKCSRYAASGSLAAQFIDDAPQFAFRIFTSKRIRIECRENKTWRYGTKTFDILDDACNRTAHAVQTLKPPEQLGDGFSKASLTVAGPFTWEQTSEWAGLQTIESAVVGPFDVSWTAEIPPAEVPDAATPVALDIESGGSAKLPPEVHQLRISQGSLERGALKFVSVTSDRILYPIGLASGTISRVDVFDSASNPGATYSPVEPIGVGWAMLPTSGGRIQITIRPDGPLSLELSAPARPLTLSFPHGTLEILSRLDGATPPSWRIRLWPFRVDAHPLGAPRALAMGPDLEQQWTAQSEDPDGLVWLGQLVPRDDRPELLIWFEELITNGAHPKFASPPTFQANELTIQGQDHDGGVPAVTRRQTIVLRPPSPCPSNQWDKFRGTCCARHVTNCPDGSDQCDC